jgi:hypothetical protein
MKRLAGIQTVICMCAVAGFACGSDGFDPTEDVIITSVVPTEGPATGGTVITVRGRNFPDNVTAVLFGTTPAASFAVQSESVATVTSPPHAPGLVSVTVMTPVDTVTVGGAFTFIGPPALTSIAPTSGVATGGTAFTLTGTGFRSGATVTIGGAAATGVAVVSATQITGTTPAGTAGARDVVITNSDGQADTLATAFTFTAPLAVTAIQPTSGQNTGGVAFTITGTGFAAGATVTIGSAAATSVTVVSATEITGLTPAGSNGPADVVVTVPGSGSATLAGGFTFTTPAAHTVTGVSRDAGSTAGGATLSVFGTSFSPGATVLFGATPATTTTFVSATELRAVVPAGSVGVVNVTVRISGSDATRNNAFEYLPAPTTIYAEQDFEGTGFSPFIRGMASGAAITIAPGISRSGSNSARCSATGSGGAASLNFTFSNPTNPPAANATGLYQRWYVRVPDTTLTNVLSGQIKMFINRHSGLINFPWLMTGIGRQFASNFDWEIVAAADYLITRLDPNGPSDTRTGVRMPADQWVEFQTWFRRVPGDTVGRVRFWINGRREIDTQASFLGNGDTSLTLQFAYCIAASQGLSGPVVVYVDAVRLANGYIDPVP